MRILGVGVNIETQAAENEIRSLVSNPQTDYFPVDDFSALEGILQQIVEEVPFIKSSFSTKLPRNGSKQYVLCYTPLEKSLRILPSQYPTPPPPPHTHQATRLIVFIYSRAFLAQVLVKCMLNPEIALSYTESRLILKTTFENLRDRFTFKTFDESGISH